MSIIVICGATATGKSDLAIALAQRFDGEIINADSMQIYKGMDIGTAKLSVDERQGVRHHLLDVLDVNQDSTVAWYQKKARAAI
ncbi:MAG: tRNA (adenosine(37)-N6)-dimethylallyltransferase MiaA, partial [Actinobacteria bacterium]|nr:tRNA (adenosine(37)-N6)-dimethylallyltransferase MiaA [Actinomycetota bacterium]